jgi:DNA polymerase III alpha subunit
MIAAMNLAGYNASEADELRKAISKKNAEALMETPVEIYCRCKI